MTHITSSKLQLNRQKRRRRRNYDWKKQVITERTVITTAKYATSHNLPKPNLGIRFAVFRMLPRVIISV
ncbi:hypothetical protein [Virgibacillus dokdonensis]|uniref:hypothetical protein n=1 Tax=Virgibacillus dokdonensis TaxID=302167 RepID=UPI0013DD5BE4|nr:hypothetical protein [Virgibacillus dokdonensis]